MQGNALAAAKIHQAVQFVCIERLRSCAWQIQPVQELRRWPPFWRFIPDILASQEVSRVAREGGAQLRCEA